MYGANGHSLVKLLSCVNYKLFHYHLIYGLVLRVYGRNYISCLNYNVSYFVKECLTDILKVFVFFNSRWKAALRIRGQAFACLNSYLIVRMFYKE
jgi:hypothetical protein